VTSKGNVNEGEDAEEENTQEKENSKKNQTEHSNN